MKKILLLLLAISSFAYGAANDPRMERRNPTDTGNIIKTMPSTAPDTSFVIINGSINEADLARLGTGLSFASGYINAAAQIQTDWNASSGLGVLLNKPSFATVAVTGAYADLTGQPSLFSGAYNDLTGKPTLFSGAYADLSGKPTLFSGAYSDLTGKPSLFDGVYTSLTSIPSTFTPSAHVHAAADVTSGTFADARIPSLAISKTTGLQAAIDAKFTIPAGVTSQYVRGDGTLATLPAAGTGTVTSITAGTGLSGGAITTTGTISMPSTGTAGTYTLVTTDAQGRVTSGSAASQSAQTRSLNSAFQVSTTRAALVNYSVRIVTTASIGGNQDGDVILEIASDSGFTVNVQTLSITQNAQAVSLAVVLNSVQTQTGVLSGYVPAGYYARLRTVNNTGTPTYLYRAGQEILM